MLKETQNQPLYSIGIVSELLDVHPETIRSWEKSGVIQPPQRRSGKRSFSQNDLKRLQFIQKLTGEGLSPRASRYYLRLYPCWQTDCTDCIHNSTEAISAKACWKESGTYCMEPSGTDACTDCVASGQPSQSVSPKSAPQQPRASQLPADSHTAKSKQPVLAKSTPAAGSTTNKTESIHHSTLYEVLQEVNSADRIQSTLHSIVENVAKEVRAKGCCLALFTPDRKRLRHMASYGLSEEYVEKCRASAEKNITEALEGKPTVILDATEDERIQYGELAKEEGIASVLSVPIILGNDMLGVLRVHTTQPRRFSEYDVFFVHTAASMGAKALEEAVSNDTPKQDYDDFRQKLLEFEWARWPVESSH